MRSTKVSGAYAADVGKRAVQMSRTRRYSSIHVFPPSTKLLDMRIQPMVKNSEEGQHFLRPILHIRLLRREIWGHHTYFILCLRASKASGISYSSRRSPDRARPAHWGFSRDHRITPAAAHHSVRASVSCRRLRPVTIFILPSRGGVCTQNLVARNCELMKDH